MPVAAGAIQSAIDADGAPSSITLTGLNVGDYIFVAGTVSTAHAHTISPSDDKGETYTAPDGLISDSTNLQQIRAWWAKVAVAGDHVISMACTNPLAGETYCGIAACAVTGAAGTAGITANGPGQHQFAAGLGTDAVTTGTAQTPGGLPALVVALSFDDSTAINPPTEGTGFASLGTGWFGGLRVEAKRITSGTAQGTFTNSANVSTLSQMIAFLEDTAPAVVGSVLSSTPAPSARRTPAQPQVLRGVALAAAAAAGVILSVSPPTPRANVALVGPTLITGIEPPEQAPVPIVSKPLARAPRLLPQPQLLPGVVPPASVPAGTVLTSQVTLPRRVPAAAVQITGTPAPGSALSVRPALVAKQPQQPTIITGTAGPGFAFSSQPQLQPKRVAPSMIFAGVAPLVVDPAGSVLSSALPLVSKQPTQSQILSGVVVTLPDPAGVATSSLPLVVAKLPTQPQLFAGVTVTVPDPAGFVQSSLPLQVTQKPSQPQLFAGVTVTVPDPAGFAASSIPPRAALRPSQPQLFTGVLAAPPEPAGAAASSTPPRASAKPSQPQLFQGVVPDPAGSALSSQVRLGPRLPLPSQILAGVTPPPLPPVAVITSSLPLQLPPRAPPQAQLFAGAPPAPPPDPAGFAIVSQPLQLPKRLAPTPTITEGVLPAGRSLSIQQQLTSARVRQPQLFAGVVPPPPDPAGSVLISEPLRVLRKLPLPSQLVTGVVPFVPEPAGSAMSVPLPVRLPPYLPAQLWRGYANAIFPGFISSGEVVYNPTFLGPIVPDYIPSGEVVPQPSFIYGVQPPFIPSGERFFDHRFIRRPEELASMFPTGTTPLIVTMGGNARMVLVQLPDKDARHHALETLKRFITLLTFRRTGAPGQETFPFRLSEKQVFDGRPDDNGGEADLPSIAFLPGTGTHQAYGMGGPDFIEETYGLYGEGSVVTSYGDYIETFTIEIVAPKIAERRALVAGLEFALRAVAERNSLSLLLPGYFNSVAEFYLQSTNYVEDNYAAQNRRVAQLTVQLTMPALWLALNVPKLDPSVGIELGADVSFETAVDVDVDTDVE
jgi:hypothetical protein